MKSSQNKYIRLRITLIGILFTGCFVLIAAKAIYLHIYQGPWLSRKAADQYERSLVVYGKRGAIYDRKNRALAVSNDVTSIAAHPSRIEKREHIAGALAKQLNLPRQSIRRKLLSQKPFVWLKRHVSPAEAAAVRQLNINGIVFKDEQSRFYPNKMLAAQVLGFSGIDGNGLEGLEYYYDRYLKGHGLKLTVLKDALGRKFVSEKDTETEPAGNNIYLTIDQTLQFMTERALADAVTQYKAESGIAVIMVPQTGEILALAHVPLFNANAFRNYRQSHWRNRAITDPFEPGSTVKIFSAAAALESGTTSAQSVFFCENGEYRIGKNIIHDSHAHGWLTLQKIVQYSSNIGIVKVGETTGTQALYQTLRAFGFGRKSGIDCPGETTGSLAPYKRWTKIDASTIAFGQGVSVSAIQLASAVNAIANDGVLMKPFIVREIKDQKGKPIKKTWPSKVRRAVSVGTARTIRQIMRTVTSGDGTGVRAALKGYSVCGKTGTAQKVGGNGTYTDGKFIASFVGFVPGEKPALTILVSIDEPRKNHYGGVVAAPVFRQIAQEALNYLNVPPDIKTDTLTVSLEEEVTG